ncbi:MAG: exo-alpha-sialidase [Parachlamydiaceae bacterium]|nr:exo-alpha-sialidase [Parachlamydiaceae bacterium]
MILKKQGYPFLVYIDKIWDFAPHNALTDLIRFKDNWYLVFRESDKHAKGANGIIRILSSHDALIWRPVCFFQESGIDLRDPKLSHTPDGRLMLLMGGTIYSDDHRYIVQQSRVAFSNDGVIWGRPTPVLTPHDWLWRVTWHRGIAYGVAYRFSEPSDRNAEWLVSLYESRDGIQYQKIVDWDIAGYPNETTLQFTKNEEMVALVRRDKKEDSHAWIGKSPAPFDQWTWQSSNYYFGGPNFIVLPSGQFWAAGRILSVTPYGEIEKTVLAKLTPDGLYPVMVLHSGGDTSYPGMVYHEGNLWISYYSSHEGHAAIYLAKIQLPSDEL